MKMLPGKVKSKPCSNETNMYLFVCVEGLGFSRLSAQWGRKYRRAYEI